MGTSSNCRALPYQDMPFDKFYEWNFSKFPYKLVFNCVS